MNKYIVWIFRIILGLLFLYAGARKMIDPTEFSDAIAGFQILPSTLIHQVALGLPLFEVVLGVLICMPVQFGARIGAFGIIVLNLGFIVLLASAWIRDLSVECGCFGLGIFPPSQWTLQISIVRDLVFLAMAYWVYRELGRAKFSFKGMKSQHERVTATHLHEPQV